MVKTVGVVVLVALVAAQGERAAGLVVAVGVLVLVGAAVRRGRVVTGFSRGSTAHVARHEAAHVAVASACGGRARVVASGDSGWTQAKLPDSAAGPVEVVAFLFAGEASEGSAGCSSDRAAVRRVLRAVPRAERARVEREGRALARRVVRAHSGRIARDAAVIERRGRL